MRLVILTGLFFSFVLFAKPRAREAGVVLEGMPGKWNAITDVKGVEVGFTTLISDPGPVRTGVSAIHPLGKKSTEQVFAGFYSHNGNGEMTGTHWIEESGFLAGPILLTNTFSVGAVHAATLKWQAQQGRPTFELGLPIVAETWDGYLNDIDGQHVKESHVFQALNNATSGPVREGNVGSGTGMTCFEFKCGIGTSSRVVEVNKRKYSVGVLVQSNFGLREQLRIAGYPVGKELSKELAWKKENGSIIGIIATDAPLLPHQLKRISRRCGMGIARLGAVSGDSSGDLFLSFSTANPTPIKERALAKASYLSNESLDTLFEASIEAMEEAVLNSLFAGETMKGLNNREVRALPVDKVIDILSQHKLLKPVK